MSGGPYGRGKAPERQCLPLQQWPDADRKKWETALQPTDPFADDGGERAGYRPHSNRKTEKGYGRWLTFVSHKDPAILDVSPEDRITRERVIAYIEELMALGNKKSTILSRLQELGDMAKLQSPDRDWSFIKRLAAKVRAGKGAPNNKRARLVTSDKLLELGCDVMDNAPKRRTPLKQALDYRDGLLIALLSLRPLRRSNVIDLSLNTTLNNHSGKWYIQIQGEQSKNHAPLEFTWPEQLSQQLEIYINVHRRYLLTRSHKGSTKAGNELFVSFTGSALTEMALYNVIATRTKKQFGHPLNPHLFRDAAATTMAIFDPKHVRLAAPLLGHKTFSTTEQYYQQARSIEASRDLGKMVNRLRGETPPAEGHKQ